MATIFLSDNTPALVDDADILLVNSLRWFSQCNLQGHIYAAADTQVSGRKKRIYLHRFLCNPPIGFAVIHKDGDGLNNHRANLEIRAAGQTPRTRTQTDASRPNYRGVHYVSKGAAHWKAVITIEGKSVHLGVFDTAEEAAHARDEAAFEKWGEKALLNFPKP